MVDPNPVSYGGARAIEVTAYLGDSVIGVKHCMDSRSDVVARKTWALLAFGAAALVSAAIAFFVSLDHAAQNQRARARWTDVEHKPAYAFRPHADGPAAEWFAFGGVAAGLIGIAAGLAGLRRTSPYYRIGTAPGVDQPIEQAPSASFPLIAPSGDHFVFNFGPGIDGELVDASRRSTLAELVASRAARPSTAIDGAFELAIPAGGRLRVRVGQTTFLVTAMPRPRTGAAPLLLDVDRRVLAYVGGSLALHLGIWAVLQLVPIEEGGMDVDFSMLGITTTCGDGFEAPPEDGPTYEAGDVLGEAVAMRLADGIASTPTAERDRARLAHASEDAPRSRDAAILAAREDGILGDPSFRDHGLASLVAMRDLSDGFGSVGSIDDAAAERADGFGGRPQFLSGRQCTSPPCGLIAAGDYHTTATGQQAGAGYGIAGGIGVLGRAHQSGWFCTLTIPLASSTGDYDKAIIRRYIKRQVDKLTYCYEKQLLGHPGIGGQIDSHFLIAPNGTVLASTATGFDPGVASCVASVIGGIEFPAAKLPGSVEVNYPFTFRAAGN